jgi:hypothetical protein
MNFTDSALEQGYRPLDARVQLECHVRLHRYYGIH